MKIEKVVGENMRRLRGAKGWSQPELGTAVGELLTGKPWLRQAVSAAESGNRAFTVSDLAAIAYALETSPAALMALPHPATASHIEVGRASIPREELESPTWAEETTSAAIGALLTSVSAVARGLDRLQDSAYPLWSAAEQMRAAGIALQHRVRLEEGGATRPGD